MKKIKRDGVRERYPYLNLSEDEVTLYKHGYNSAVERAILHQPKNRRQNLPSKTPQKITNFIPHKNPKIYIPRDRFFYELSTFNTKYTFSVFYLIYFN